MALGALSFERNGKEGAMKLFRKLRGLLEYRLFYAALLPTLIILIAAGVVLAGGEGAAALTTPAIPIYKAS
jgi:hypothetical protein